MPPIINATFVTLDGVVNFLDTWHFDHVNEESTTIALDQLNACEALLMGRRTYEAYAGTWPARSGAYADRINAMEKFVASTTLTSPTWANTTVLDGDLVERVKELRSGDGGPILMHGFGPVAKSLLGAGLLDELHLWYHPAFAGLGGADDRLHTDGLAARLRHTGTTTLSSGVVILSYTSG